jgi:hypothetical protein
VPTLVVEENRRSAKHGHEAEIVKPRWHSCLRNGAHCAFAVRSLSVTRLSLITLVKRTGRKMVRLSMALLVFASVSAPATATDVRIGDTPLHLPPPAGYCELDPVLASDAPLIGRIHATIAKTGNRLLVMSAECAELKDWRNGKRQDVDHLAQYQTIIAFESQPLPEEPEKIVQNYCRNMIALGDQAMPGTARGAQKRADQASKLISANEMMFLGVVAEDPLVCYAATLQKFKIDAHEETTQVTIVATTVLKDKVVAYYLFAPYGGRESIVQLLAKHRTNVSQLQRANRD